jgi:ketosteroid isomerase-like protein
LIYRGKVRENAGDLIPTNGDPMQESSDVREAVERFWGLIGEADFDGLGGALTAGPIAQVIGSAPGEGHDDRETWIAGFRSMIEGMPGVRVDPGVTRGYANGDTGYAIGAPTWHLPGDMTVQMRSTFVLQRENGDWKIVHLHASVGVPDEQAVQMQAETRAATGAA